MDPLIVGLDLGTTLCKASAYELDGTLVTSTMINIDTIRPFAGWAEQDPEEWKRAIIDVLTRLVSQLGEQANRIVSIGLSNHGPCVIPVDENFHSLGRCPIWQDQRAADLVDELIDKTGQDWIGLGTPESSFGVQLYWLTINNPGILADAVYLLDVKGYLLANLTGKVVNEPSSSPGGRTINQKLFKVLNLDLDLLAEPVQSLSVVGRLTDEILRLTKLPAEVKIVAGLNDGAAATLGAGIVNLGQGIVSLSTNGVMRTTIPQRLPGATLQDYSMFCYSYVDEMYITGGMTKCGGDSVKWLIDNFYRDYGDGPEVFEAIESEVAQSPIGADGVKFMPYLVGMGTPNPTKVAQGAFFNLGRHHTRADFTRAVMEGTAFALREIGETFCNLGISWENLTFTGGGSKNKIWRQIVADILNKSLNGANSDSVLGAAITAATGVGLYPAVGDAVKTMVTKSFQVEPIKENVIEYDRMYDTYTHLKDTIKQISSISE